MMDAKALSKWRNPGRVLAAARALERSSRTSIASPATAPGVQKTSKHLQKTSKHQHRSGLQSADSRAIVIDWSAARPPSLAWADERMRAQVAAMEEQDEDLFVALGADGRISDGLLDYGATDFGFAVARPLKYVDEDNDHITLNSQSDLDQLYYYCRSQQLGSVSGSSPSSSPQT